MVMGEGFSQVNELRSMVGMVVMVVGVVVVMTKPSPVLILTLCNQLGDQRKSMEENVTQNYLTPLEDVQVECLPKMTRELAEISIKF